MHSSSIILELFILLYIFRTQYNNRNMFGFRFRGVSSWKICIFFFALHRITQASWILLSITEKKDREEVTSYLTMLKPWKSVGITLLLPASSDIDTSVNGDVFRLLREDKIIYKLFWYSFLLREHHIKKIRSTYWI